jgi:hypothetical protein
MSDDYHTQVITAIKRKKMTILKVSGAGARGPPKKSGLFQSELMSNTIDKNKLRHERTLHITHFIASSF